MIRSLPRLRENSLDTTGFSRVVHQLQPNQSRTLFGYHRLQPRGVSVSAYFARKQSWKLKLKLHAAEADGICDHLSANHLGSS